MEVGEQVLLRLGCSQVSWDGYVGLQYGLSCVNEQVGIVHGKWRFGGVWLVFADGI